MKPSAPSIVAAVLVFAAAFAFWTLGLSPKRDEVKKLNAQIETLDSSVESARGELAAATSARLSFPVAYRQLVELGQAVPATDETPSLLVELEKLAHRSEVSFKSMALSSEGEAAAPEVAVETPPTSETGPTGTQVADVVPATEIEASLLPLGARVGGAGLATMPYTLDFSGSFFGIAKFIGKVDDLVRAGSKMQIDGRLVTISSFSLSAGAGSGEDEGGGAGELQASFQVTTYLTPPGQGIGVGATPSGPDESSSQTVAAE